MCKNVLGWFNTTEETGDIAGEPGGSRSGDDPTGSVE